MWLDVPDFKEKLKDWWEVMIVKGSASTVFGQKLKMLKEKILRWKKEDFGEIERGKQDCLQKLAAFDLRGMSNSLSKGGKES